MYVLLNAFLAIVPSIALLFYFVRRDNRKKEPFDLVWKTFILGSFAVAPAIIVEGAIKYMGARFAHEPWFRAFFVAALTEEVAKFAVLRFYVWRKKDFDEVADGMVYTVSASLGLALFENLLYSFGDTATLVIRGLTAVPLHAAAAGIMGYYAGLARFTGEKVLLKGVFLAVLVHGLYDYFLFEGGLLSFAVIPLLVVLGLVVLRLFRKALVLDREAGRS